MADGVATVTLMRPDAGNSLNDEAFRDFWQVAMECESDPDVHAVIVTATGRMYCSGGDLRYFADQGDDMPRALTENATIFHAGIVRLQRMDAPVIVAVNGVAAGAGISLVAAGDIVIASRDAVFVSAYTASGLTPDGSSTYFVAKHVGLMRAKEFTLLNRRLSAEEACDWGLVTRVVPADDLMKEAYGIASDLAKGPTKACGGSKRLMLSAFEGSLEHQLELETVSISNMARTRDGRHGVETFAACGKPEFEGR